MSVSPLARLQALNPKQAATFCAETATVEAWRKKVSRRADGTIRGYHDGAGSQWESYRLDISKALERAEKRERARESVRADEAASRKRLSSKLEAQRAELEALQACPRAGLPAVAIDAMNEQEKKLKESIRGLESKL